MHHSWLMGVLCFAFVAAGVSRETGQKRGLGRELKQAYGPAPSRSAVCVPISGIDFYGGDISGGIPTRSNTSCCDLCGANPSCKGWTRTKSGSCYLKSVLNAPTICKQCSASGFIEYRQSSREDDKLKAALRRLSGSSKTPLRTKAAIDIFLSKDLGVYGG